jgi:hypothetical protein
VTGGREAPRITHEGDECGRGDEAHAGYGEQPLHGRDLLGEAGELSLTAIDTLSSSRIS